MQSGGTAELRGFRLGGMTVIDWLLDSDPSIRWQVMRDLTPDPAEVVAAERSRVATGSYFGVDMTPLVERLLAEQLPDGGWNCEVENGATVSSFGTTINVLEGLAEHERATGGSAGVRAARRRGEEYLLERRLFRRKTTGEVIDPGWLRFSFPHWYHYDVLRGLEHLRGAEVEPGERVAEAIEVVEGNRGADGRWPLQNVHAGETHFQMEDGEGKPSRWNTLRALRVLDWFAQGG